MITVQIWLNPGSSRVGCWRDPYRGIVCAVRELPHDGKANKALVALCAELLNVSPSSIRMTRGFTARIKILVIAKSFSREEIERLLCGGADAIL
jgi:uncharacterized protein YggU (UPF0235/DUF167 family)